MRKTRKLLKILEKNKDLILIYFKKTILYNIMIKLNESTRSF